MAKVIEFPKESKSYDNFRRIISVATNETLEFYAELMAVSAEEGYFLPGEYEKLTEQLRQRRLDNAKPEPKPAVEALKPGLYLYYPEMGEQKPQCQIEAERSYYGRHYHLRTPLSLKGRGIVFDGVLDADRLSQSAKYQDDWREYTVTERAFDKLQEQYTISQEAFLD